MPKLSTIVLTTLLLCAVTSAAKADYFIWRDVKSGVSLSFPDTWRIVANQLPDDVVTVMAPSGRANAMCRVRVNSERRFLIYPSQYGADIQQLNYSKEFWDQYFKIYYDDSTRETMDEGGLGREWAGFTEASYESAVPGPEMPRRGIAFAGVYNDKAYILDCSSHRDAFADWKGPFMGIAHSIDMFPAYHQLTSGNYRDFMADPRMDFTDVKGRYVDQY